MKRTLKKTLAWLLAVGMLASNVTAFAEAAAVEDHSYERPFDVNVQMVEASGDQIALEAHVKDIIEVDGLKFKDLNDNGKLDVYEDWRQETEARVNDLYEQMTIDEKIGTLYHATVGGTFTSLYPINEEFLWSNESEIFVDGAGYSPVFHQIVSDHNTTFLQNVNGTPEEQLYENNSIQEIGEYARLGIPVVFSSDRSYNTWGGMVNMANYAFGVAHDAELLEKMVANYSQQMNALGYHLVFHSYGVEIGSWYGAEPSYIADMTAVETAAYEANGVNATTKHFIARGGRYSYADGKSPADLLDTWMVGWQAAVDAGTSWVMMNHGKGLNDCYPIYDKATVDLLREELGYDGVIVTDWPMWVGTPSASGTNGEGVDLSTLNAGQLYTIILEAGIDQFGGFFMVDGTDESQEYLTANYPGHSFALTHYPDSLKAEIEAGNCDIALVERSVKRVLTNKFDLGLFEDPYRDLESLLKLAASEEYQAEQFAITSIEDIYAARNAEQNELEIALQTKSTVLLKNEGNILPLAEGTKVYVTGTDEDEMEADAEAIAEYAEVVEDVEEADVVIARISEMDYIEDVVDEAEGKKLILAVQAGNGSNEPNAYAVENASALLMMTYAVTPDHGSSIGTFYHYTLPSTLAEMLFGDREPTGSLVMEIARNPEDEALEWGELGVDTGVDVQTRLYMAGVMRQNPAADLPNNLGDVLFPSEFGMRYGENADITTIALTMDQVVSQKEVSSPWGTSIQTVAGNKPIASGETFQIYMIAENKGADGIATIEAYEGETLLAAKPVSIEGGSFTVVTLDVMLEGAGQHVITVGENTLTVEVQ